MRWILLCLALVAAAAYYWGDRTGVSDSPDPKEQLQIEPSLQPAEPTESVTMMPLSRDVPGPGDSVEVELVEPAVTEYAGGELTESDRAYKAVLDRLLRRTLVYDANLGHAARELAVQHSLLEGLVPQHIVEFLLHSAGAIDKSVVQAFTATSGDDMTAIEKRLSDLLDVHAANRPLTRVGIGEAYIPGARRSRHIAILLSHRQVEIAPTPRQVPLGSQWVMSGILPPDHDEASSLVLRPNGILEAIPITVVDRRFTLTVAVGDAEGTMHVSVGAEGPHGHTPMLQVSVEVGRDVPLVLASRLLPGESDIEGPTTAESLAFDLLNRDRKAHGLSPLIRDEELDRVARRHSVDMRDNGYFGHYSHQSGYHSDRLMEAGFRSGYSAENVAKGPSIHGAQAGLMHSLGHRRNILRKETTHVGLGVSGNRTGGRTVWWLTQLFAVPVERVRRGDGVEVLSRRVQALRKEKNLPPFTLDSELAAIAREGVTELASGGGKGVPQRLLSDIRRRFPQWSGLMVWAASTTNLSTLSLPVQLQESSASRLGIAVYQHPDHPNGLTGVVIVTSGGRSSE